MNLNHFYLFILALLFLACKQNKLYLTKIEGKQIAISDSLRPDPGIETFIKPYRDHLSKDLDSILAYSEDTYSKSDGDFNTTIGNFRSEDAVYSEANPIFNARTGKNIDMVLLNHGGIRAMIPKGNITTRTAFEIMPFENSIVVVALNGKQINSMLTYLVKTKKAHPFCKLKLILDKNFNLKKATINGKVPDTLKTYYVATHDYLYNGGDNMNFFKPNDSLYVLDYKMRNALIDHFKRVDTINPVIDDRFIQIK